MPSNTPPGDYTYTLNVGNLAEGVVVDAEVFEVEVTGSARTGGAASWAVVDASPWAAEGPVAVAQAGVAGVAAYPNPLTARTTLSFALPVTADVRLAVYDVLGREVAVLAEGTMDAGQHEIRWNASALPSGVTCGGWRRKARCRRAG